MQATAIKTLRRQPDTVDEFYGPNMYKLDKETLADLKKLKPYRPVLAAIGAWIAIFALVKTYLAVPALIFLYPVLIFFIAGRAGVFLQLAHEGAHGLLGSRKFNEWFGNWVCSYPIGLDFKGYAEPHVLHHACTNRLCDPISDREKYKVCDIRNPRLWLLLLKDITGITALQVRFLYDRPLSNQDKRDITGYMEAYEDVYEAYKVKASSLADAFKKYAGIGVMQLAILGLLFNFNFFHYIALWALPLMTAHMFLMRVRGIAEHGLGIQLGVSHLDKRNRGTLYTRSFGTGKNYYAIPLLTFLERCLIGSLQVFYHHEHHLFPKVPYYNLAKLHKLIAAKEERNNPAIFAKGYFSCLFTSLRIPRATY